MKRIDFVKNSPMVKPWDTLIILLLVVIGVVAIAISFQPVGRTVEVTHNGNLIYSEDI